VHEGSLEILNIGKWRKCRFFIYEIYQKVCKITLKESFELLTKLNCKIEIISKL